MSSPAALADSVSPSPNSAGLARSAGGGGDPNKEPGDACLSDDEKKLIVRQQERTIDNVKRLFALIFSISFSQILVDVITAMEMGQLKSFKKIYVLEGSICLFVFLTTAFIFYYQGARFLDVRYALVAEHEFVRAKPLGFGFDFFTLLVTMLPFIAMGKSMVGTVVHAYGFAWFYISYALLLFTAILSIALSRVRPAYYYIKKILKSDQSDLEYIQQSEIDRDLCLIKFWVNLDTLALLLIVIVFCLCLSFGVHIPLHHKWQFWLSFGIIAISRNVIDIWISWPLIYPNPDKDPEEKFSKAYPVIANGKLAKLCGGLALLFPILLVCGLGLERVVRYLVIGQ